MASLTKTEKNLIKDFKLLYGNEKNHVLIEVKKNTFVARSVQSGKIPFHLIIRTGRASIKIDPEKFPNVPWDKLQCLVKVIEKRFPELKNKFSHKPPQVQYFNQRDKDLSDYSKGYSK